VVSLIYMAKWEVRDQTPPLPGGRSRTSPFAISLLVANDGYPWKTSCVGAVLRTSAWIVLNRRVEKYNKFESFQSIGPNCNHCMSSLSANRHKMIPLTSCDQDHTPRNSASDPDPSCLTYTGNIVTNFQTSLKDREKEHAAVVDFWRLAGLDYSGWINYSHDFDLF